MPALTHNHFCPRVETLEGRWLPASYTLTPVVPDIDAGEAARLSEVIRFGQQQGNRINVFARAGDSITASGEFLIPLGRPSVGTDLAGDGSLNATLEFFRSGRIGAQNPFSRASTAATGGWTSAHVLAQLPTELALTKPAFVLIMIGTNDISAGVPLEVFQQNLTAITQTALNMGVVPVLSTIPDLIIAPFLQERQPSINQAIQDVGDSLGVPVWNYWRALQRLPQAGISADLVHPSLSPSGGGDLTETGLRFGYNVRNLTALQTLDKLKRVLLLGEPPDLPSDNAGWAPLTHALAVASGDTTGFQVQVIDPVTRRTLFRFDPFVGYAGGVRVATADLNHDGFPDLIAVPGRGGPPHVKAFDGRTGSLLASFYAFDANFLAGLSVAAADVTGDGRAEIIVCPESNSPAHVKVFTIESQLVTSFYAFAPAFQGGATVTAADTDGDGRAEIIAAAGRGGQGHVAVFSGAGFELISSFLPFGNAFTGEAALAAGDLDGDGRAELAVGVAAGGSPWVTLFHPLTGAPIRGFNAYDPGFLGGMKLAMFDRGDGRSQLVTASNPAAVTDVRLFDALSGGVLSTFPLYEVGFRRGVSFGG